MQCTVNEVITRGPSTKAQKPICSCCPRVKDNPTQPRVVFSRSLQRHMGNVLHGKLYYMLKILEELF